MSKRLQVIMPDDEYEAVQRVARQRGGSVSRLVRESLQRAIANEAEVDPERRIAAILRFARYTGPAGDIEEVLSEIERGPGTASMSP